MQCQRVLLGVFHPCLWSLKAPGSTLGEGRQTSRQPADASIPIYTVIYTWKWTNFCPPCTLTDWQSYQTWREMGRILPVRFLTPHFEVPATSNTVSTADLEPQLQFKRIFFSRIYTSQCSLLATATITTTFGFCLTSLFSQRSLRLGQVLWRSRKKNFEDSKNCTWWWWRYHAILMCIRKIAVKPA